MIDIKKGLTKGLTLGYGGKSSVVDVKRDEFVGKSSHVVLEDGVYHDEWFAGDRTGGGQELLRIGDKKYTRVYAGGVPEGNVLKELGLTENDVSSYLINKIVELGDRTRLFEDCTPGFDGGWQYKYRVTERFEESGTVTGIESIDYKGVRVHVHAFVLCPIE